MDDEGAILQSGVQSEIDLALITRKSLTEIAIDVGTTTLVASLLDMQTGACLGTAAEYNGQCAYGEDVLTRTLRALESDGAYLLQQAAMKTINGLIRKLCARIEIDNRDIAAVVIGANTIMVHLLLGFDPSRICREPFDGRRQYLIVVPASESVSGKNIVITQTDIDNIMAHQGSCERGRRGAAGERRLCHGRRQAFLCRRGIWQASGHRVRATALSKGQDRRFSPQTS
jgi:uncharacterized 2Fe-2S/4Fe-4S cluster protein (DUF4445 family)